MRKEYYVIVISISFVISFAIQTYTVFSYLEAIEVWPPTLPVTGIIFVLSLAFSIFLGMMASKSEKKKNAKKVFFWLSCVALVFPCNIYSFDILLNAILGR